MLERSLTKSPQYFAVDFKVARKEKTIHPVFFKRTPETDKFPNILVLYRQFIQSWPACRRS